MFQTNVVEKIIHFMFYNLFYENRVVCEIMWKNTAEPDRRQITIQYGACALHGGYLKLPKHSQNM